MTRIKEAVASVPEGDRLGILVTAATVVATVVGKVVL